MLHNFAVGLQEVGRHDIPTNSLKSNIIGQDFPVPFGLRQFQFTCSTQL